MRIRDCHKCIVGLTVGTWLFSLNVYVTPPVTAITAEDAKVCLTEESELPEETET